MPFVSQAQRGWMFANHPQMAKEWAAHTPKGKKLPQHVGKKPKSKAKVAEYTPAPSYHSTSNAPKRKADLEEIARMLSGLIKGLEKRPA